MSVDANIYIGAYYELNINENEFSEKYSEEEIDELYEYFEFPFFNSMSGESSKTTILIANDDNCGISLCVNYDNDFIREITNDSINENKKSYKNYLYKISKETNNKIIIDIINEELNIKHGFFLYYT